MWQGFDILSCCATHIEYRTTCVPPQGFASMKVGEKAILKIRHDYGYGENGSPPKIPGGATLLFDVELLGWEVPPKQRWEMTTDEKLDKAREMKAEGTAKFTAKNWALAADAYEDSVSYSQELAGEADDSEGEEPRGGAVVVDEASALYTSCLGNAAQCYINMGDYPSAIANCTKILEKDPETVKVTKQIAAFERR